LGSDEEKKEITVKAPSKSAFSAEKKAEKAAVKALEEERFNVIKVSQKFGKYFGVLSICIGAVLLTFLAYTTFAFESNSILLTTTSIPILSLWMTAGLISIVVGFLLMGSE
jgi:hypothetical protein